MHPVYVSRHSAAPAHKISSIPPRGLSVADLRTAMKQVRSFTSFGGRSVAVALVAAGMVLLRGWRARAATLPVTSTADVATNFGACGNSAQTTSSGSLREAVCAANN